AIGCTGGQHRSVALATVLAERLAKQFNFVSAIHRDMRRTAS
ncbi:MAG: RNase adaptor protein RapZ, partial [Rhizobiaceae bacterium]|nr:RNase adaptor protein RapZ [Rhizobiaceae bacterium]